MSLIRSTIRGILAATVLCPLVPSGRAAPGKQELGDQFKADTVWRGTLVYGKSDYTPESKPQAMVLYVKRRKGAEFQGSTWYPTQGNGVLKVKGKVGREGKFTFTEEKVIHGKAGYPDNPEGVQAPNEFVGRLEKNTIKGTGRWKGPAFNGEVLMTFRLKLAE